MYVFCIFLWVAYLYMRLSFFLSVWVSSLRFDASILRMNSYLYIFGRIILFGSCERSASAGFCSESSFFFCASFTYLELLCLRYFSYAGFISACFNLRYRSVLSLMRLSQYLHVMRQLVEWFGFPSILTWSADIFRSIPDFSMSIIFLSLQYLTVWHRRSQFAISDARFF